jgi:Lar family restriction alleviation protein
MIGEIRARLTKPCPCCGSKKIMMDSPKFIRENDLKVVELLCKDCGLSMKVFVGDSEGRASSVKEAYQIAVKRWNRRAA